MQQSALRSLAIVCDYMETTLFAIVCDLQFAIRDRLRSSAIIWKPALICSLQYQSVVYFSALTKARNALRQLELNFHNFLSVYSLIPTKYRWLTTVTVCKLKLSYIKSYWHGVIWHNEVLASRVRGVLQQGLLLSLKAPRKWSYFGEWMWCYHPNADPNGLCLCTSDLWLNSSRKIPE